MWAVFIPGCWRTGAWCHRRAGYCGWRAYVRSSHQLTNHGQGPAICTAFTYSRGPRLPGHLPGAQLTLRWAHSNPSSIHEQGLGWRESTAARKCPSSPLFHPGRQFAQVPLRTQGASHGLCFLGLCSALGPPAHTFLGLLAALIMCVLAFSPTDTYGH